MDRKNGFIYKILNIKYFSHLRCFFVREVLKLGRFGMVDYFGLI